MRGKLKKVWEFLTCVGWALAHMADAEMEYERSKRTCSNCGHVRQGSTGCGPR